MAFFPILYSTTKETDMSKATHNGTCQSCGRSQAVNAKTGRLAKHGYTVDYGYFNGTCAGSDSQPLELETSLNVETVAAIRDWANQQEQFADGNIETVIVQVRDHDDSRSWATKDLRVNRSEYIELKRRGDDTEFDDLYSSNFDDKVENVRCSLRRNAASARKDADLLEQLRDKTFGNDLTPRQADTQPQRESFAWDSNGGAMAKAYDRQRELKAEGIKSRVTGDARYATISYRK